MFDDEDPDYEDARREAQARQERRRASLAYGPDDPDRPFADEEEE
jgi:hypothetical protein